MELSGRIDALNATLERLSHLVEEKDAKIVNLEREVRELADANDSLEQYTRRPNLRFEGIPEADHGEDTDAKVLKIANSKLGMTPPLELGDLERSHAWDVASTRTAAGGHAPSSCAFRANACATRSTAHARS